MSREKADGSNSSAKSRRRARRSDPGRWIQDYLGNSNTAEETLFKINELLHAGAFEDTRKTPRAPISFPVECRLQNQSFQGSCYTLSQHGMFIRCAMPPSPDSALELLLHLPDGGPALQVEGQVIQAKPYQEAVQDETLSGMSVVFTRIRPEDRRRIEKLVNAWSRRMKSGA